MPLSDGQTNISIEEKIETNSRRKEVRIGNMFKDDDPGDYIFELDAYDVGIINIIQGTEVVFYCPYNFEVGGAADDVWGYIECQLGGAGYDEVRTGEQKIG